MKTRVVVGVTAAATFAGAVAAMALSHTGDQGASSTDVVTTPTTSAPAFVPFDQPRAARPAPPGSGGGDTSSHGS